jgi:NitT/TauT family transport system substrate-binding protein
MQPINCKPIFNPLALIVLVFMMVSCRQGQTNEDPVKIGLNEWIGNSPFIIADKAGIFSENEAHVELMNFTSSQQVIEALRNGEINGATLTFDKVVTLVNDGFLLKVVLVIDFS